MAATCRFYGDVGRKLTTATSFLSKTSDGMACRHPFGLPPTQVLQDAFDSGGTVETGLVSITRALTARRRQIVHRGREQAAVSITRIFRLRRSQATPPRTLLRAARRAVVLSTKFP